MNKIKLLRTERGLSQQQLAAALYVHQTAISQWESGKTNPDTQQAIAAADFFNVSIDYLLGRTDIRNNTPMSEPRKTAPPPEYPAGTKWAVLSREENELIRIYRALDIRDCHKLMDYAFRLEQGEVK